MALCDPLGVPILGHKAGVWVAQAKQPLETSACETYLLQSYWGTSCAGQQASTAATDQYCTTYDTSTTDSAVSEQDALACTELLLASESAFATDQPVATKTGGKGPFAPFSSFNTPAQHEVRETIRYEMARERETQPQFYFKRHAFLSKELRGIAVSWAIQVVDQFRVEQETLFLAVSYLDRFLSITEDVVHMDGLHLATLACLSLAAKQAEVTQPSTAEWTWLVHANSWGNKEQLSRMEWIIMDSLEWRGCTPTAWWFLHLFCYGLGTCPAPAICMAAYLLELGLLEAGCLAYSFSALAAAALMLGHTAIGLSCPVDSIHEVAGQPMMQVEVSDGGLAGVSVLAIQSLVELAPELNLHQVQDACAVLADLHMRACTLPTPLPDQALEGLQLARAKYSNEVWHHVGGWQVPVNLKAALDRF